MSQVTLDTYKPYLYVKDLALKKHMDAIYNYTIESGTNKPMDILKTVNLDYYIKLANELHFTKNNLKELIKNNSIISLTNLINEIIKKELESIKYQIENNDFYTTSKLVNDKNMSYKVKLYELRWSIFLYLFRSVIKTYYNIYDYFDKYHIIETQLIKPFIKFVQYFKLISSDYNIFNDKIESIDNFIELMMKGLHLKSKNIIPIYQFLIQNEKNLDLKDICIENKIQNLKNIKNEQEQSIYWNKQTKYRNEQLMVINKLNQKIDGIINQESITDKSNIQNNECCICMEDIIDIKITLICQHFYCKECIDNWRKKSKDCPICRKPIKVVNQIDSKKDNIPLDKKSTEILSGLFQHQSNPRISKYNSVNSYDYIIEHHKILNSYDTNINTQFKYYNSKHRSELSYVDDDHYYKTLNDSPENIVLYFPTKNVVFKSPPKQNKKKNKGCNIM
jgi:hypothetical protein